MKFAKRMGDYNKTLPLLVIPVKLPEALNAT